MHVCPEFTTIVCTALLVVSINVMQISCKPWEKKFNVTKNMIFIQAPKMDRKAATGMYASSSHTNVKVIRLRLACLVLLDEIDIL